MNVLVIDDRPELQTLKLLGLPNEQVFVLDKQQSLYDAAQEARRRTNVNGPWVIFINLFLSCADEEFQYLQKQAGIALLKYLRLLNVVHHVVLVSPYSALQLIRQQPGNFIISSKGVSVTECSYNFDEFTYGKLKQLAGDTFDSNLKPYILAEIRLPEDERHNWANWWGVKQLCDVHRRVDPHPKFETANSELSLYPAAVTSQLRNLASLQAVKLYGHSFEDLDRAILDSLINQKKREFKDSEIRIEYLKGQKQLTQNWRKKPKTIVDFISYWKAVIQQNVVDGNNEYNAELFSQIKDKAKELEDAENELKHLPEKTHDLGKEISALEDKKSKDALSDIIRPESGMPIIHEVRNRNPKILFIDDQAEDGWSEIFQNMIYGRRDEKFVPLIPRPFEVETPERTSLYYKSNVRRYLPDVDLVLLDLRLHQEAGMRLDIENYSGAVLLEMLRRDFPGIPVLMTTASNKVWTYEKLLQLGMDAYWIKEALDVSSSLGREEKATWSLSNYWIFCNLIKKLTGNEYDFLKRFSQRTMQLKSAKTPWWANVKWYNPELFQNQIEIIERDGFYLSDVTAVLDYGILLYREWLRLFVIFEISDPMHSSRLLANLINTLSGIIEIVHRKFEKGVSKYCDNQEIGGTFKEESFEACRGDYLAFYLLEFRNRASHYCSEPHVIDHDFFKIFVKGLLTWLTVDFQQMPPSSIRATTWAEWNEIRWGEDKTKLLMKFETLVESNKKLRDYYWNF